MESKLYVYNAEINEEEEHTHYIAISDNWRNAKQLIIEAATGMTEDKSYGEYVEEYIKLIDEAPIEIGFLWEVDPKSV